MLRSRSRELAMGTSARDASTTERGRVSAVQRLNEVLLESRRIRRQLEHFIPHEQSESSTDMPEAFTDAE
jgi:hypothetical protein